VDVCHPHAPHWHHALSPKVIPVVHLQRLVVYVRRLLTSDKNLALCVGEGDIKPFISLLHQPFLLKAVAPAFWELNTYAHFWDRFEPRPYLCSEANFAWPVPPEPPLDWFDKIFK